MLPIMEAHAGLGAQDVYIGPVIQRCGRGTCRTDITSHSLLTLRANLYDLHKLLNQNGILWI